LAEGGGAESTTGEPPRDTGEADLRALPLLLLLLLTLLAAACSGGDDPDGVRIGALLPLTGSLASYGEASEATLEAARDAINESAERTVELVVRDTETDPEAVLDALEELHEDGIDVVVGPYASSSVEAVQEYADTNGIVLVSPLSTAGTLALPDDNIFRFTPDERAEGEAVAAVLLEDGVETVIPVTRDDAGNRGLQVGLKAAFEAAGGTVVEGVTYAADEDDFAAVVADIVELIETHASDSTAVYLTAFGEVAQLFNAASGADDPALTSLPWYGSDSVALSAELLADRVAAEFAVQLGYPNPILGLRDEDSALWQPVIEAVEEEIGRRPDTFALAAYDALVVLHTALESAGADADAEAIGAAFVSAARGHTGLTGPTDLNAAGDRAHASFDFWSVCPDGSEFAWVRTISFTQTSGEATITRTNC
jgi:branched-chain amino acid transport system substrate-binding protein